MWGRFWGNRWPLAMGNARFNEDLHSDLSPLYAEQLQDLLQLYVQLESGRIFKGIQFHRSSCHIDGDMIIHVPTHPNINCLLRSPLDPYDISV